MGIHPSAMVDPGARLGRDVVIGPHAIIEDGVTIGDRCQIDAFAVIKRDTTLGTDNCVAERATLGGLPQHVSKPQPVGRLTIGNHNTIRENCTLHRSLKPESTTLVGDHNYLMVGTHVAHDCEVGNHAIFANNATLGGHVIVEDRAYISGNVAIHQFCRIGQLAMLAGLSRVVRDVPPFVTVDGQTGCVVGLNTVGIRRAGFSTDDIAQLKAAYRVIYRSRLTWQQILDRLHDEFGNGPAAAFAEFLPKVTRGIVQERRLPPGATVKMTEEAIPAPTAERDRRVAGA